MVHLRYNEKESNPNPRINFITPLPGDVERQEDAHQLLRALAAQVRPVMKQHGFSVNSFEEYEYNEVFAGRNWNNGETVEIVLRKANGSFYPTYWLMSTLCHELAHIKHMNHGPGFQALWSRLRAEVRQLQDRGYFGDGFWSAGTRLRDFATVGGDGIDTGDLPEYMCGGAQSKARPTATHRRRGGPRGKRREVVPSLHTGAQTAKKRKAGGRVTSKYAFTGEGAKLADAEDGKGTGFGKRANSKRARDERAMAIERRLMALQGGLQDLKPKKEEDLEYSEGDESDYEIVPETNAERRQTLLESQQDDKDLIKLESKDSWEQFKYEFNFQGPKLEVGGSIKLWKVEDDSDDVLEIFDSDEESGRTCDVPTASGSTFTSGNLTNFSSSSKGRNKPSVPFGPGKLLQSEIEFRKKEGLGMAPLNNDREGTLGGKSKSTENPRAKVKTTVNSGGADPIDVKSEHERVSQEKASFTFTPTPNLMSSVKMWSCQVCTLCVFSVFILCAS
ncbi:WLM domain-containing protein [Crepidotus variabilis]|uniref:WLM domain-containing protein n=1 Tax=Crepidotus variabilis TaxID=179855 RepID=A0A9P6E8V1_9AGAR|nr:WLM domain-containing protein [Crepidotus variabilis]